ncbi:MAG: NAD-dependent epimerase/dehydratase family protein, partial [Bacillota bacterium]
MIYQNYFVTGGAGFIGRETVRHLLLNKCRVTVYDDFSFGRKENLEEFKENKLLEVITGKVEDSDNLSDKIMRLRPEVIIHLAAIHFIPFCNNNTLETIKINVDGTYSVLDAAARFGVKRVMLASSGAIYASELHCLSEKNDRPSPVDVYGCSKLLAENIGEYFSHTSSLEVTSMRFFNTYGPFETNKHLIPEIIEQIKKGNNIFLGNITSKRDYIFTEDIAKAIVMLSECKNLKKYEVVNIGTGIE